VAVQKFRDISQMPDVPRPRDWEETLRRLEYLWSLPALLGWELPTGVQRFASIEDANQAQRYSARKRFRK